MTRLCLTTLLIAMLASQAFAQSNSTYNFLRNDVSARAASLAGSFLTVPDDPNGLFYNPASLTTLTTSRGSAGFFKQLLDVNSGHLSYARQFEDLGTFAAGILFTDYGSFTEADDQGNTGGTFGASDLAVVVGWGTAIDEQFSVGASVKFIHSSIGSYGSSALAVDAGLLYRVPDTKLTLGASVRNLGTQLQSYASTREQLPLDIAIGISILPRGLPLLLNAGVHRLSDDTETAIDRLRAFTIGGEFTLSRVLQLRIGYDNAKRKDLKLATTAGLAGFSVGLGVNVSSYRVDYSLNSLGGIGNLHRVTIGAEL